jgi:hypothetical protein
VFKTQNGAQWCLDGQQRVTTTMLLTASARDALLRIQQQHPDLPTLSSALAKLDAVLFVDIPAAYAHAAAQTEIAVGERLSFCRLVPSFLDRQPFFELMTRGLASRGTDALLSESTLHSVQYDTKHYFDEQFQQLLDSNSRPVDAVDAVMDRATAALNLQLMMIEPLSTVNVAQVYQWLQESSLISMGALLFNRTPGMKMHASDLARNLFLSPWAGEPLDEQERQHALLWLNPIEVPCANSPARIDRILRVIVALNIPKGQTSETEKKLVAVSQTPGLSKQDLTGLLLYARLLTLWELYEEEVRDSIEDVIPRQKCVATRIMQMLSTLSKEIY